MSKELDIPCQTFVKIMQCDCGGELKLSSDLEDLRVGPPYKHICNKCGRLNILNQLILKHFQVILYQKLRKAVMEQKIEIGKKELLLELLNKEIYEFCKDCSAWSGKDCTRHPYEEGCLKDMCNLK